MDKPLVSVITACYNDAPYIIECVESVQASDYPNIEHIIIDDGSNLETKKVLETIHYPNVKIISQVNSGVCLARNRALQEAQGAYVLPLDGDDYISPSYISQAVLAFESDPNILVVTSQKSQMFGASKGVIEVPANFEFGLLLSRNLFTISSLFKRKDALKIGGFDLDFKKGLEDWNFWISLLSSNPSCNAVKVLPGTFFYYRIKRKHRNTDIKLNMEIRELHRLIWDKHKSLYSVYYADPFNTYAYQSLMYYNQLPLISIIFMRIRAYIKKLLKV